MDNHSSSKERPKKRRRTTTCAKVPIQRLRILGRLEPVKELPPELLLQIASNLPVRGLIHLSQVGPEFSDLLLPNEGLWRSALAEAGVPNCPEGMTCLAYARLLFDPVCTNCGANTTCEPSLILRARLCMGCCDLVLDPAWSTADRPGFPLIPLDERRTLFSMVPYMEPIIDFEEVSLQGLREWHCDKEVLISMAHEYCHISAERPEELPDFIQAKQKLMRAREQESRNFSSWQLKCIREANAAKEAAIRLFRDEVYRRLQAEGYPLETFGQIESTDIRREWREQTRKPKTMTDKGKLWSNLLPKLKILLDRYQDMLKKRARNEHLDRMLKKITAWVNIDKKSKDVGEDRFRRITDDSVYFTVSIGMVRTFPQVQEILAGVDEEHVGSAIVLQQTDLSVLSSTIRLFRKRVEVLAGRLLLEGVSRLDNLRFVDEYDANMKGKYPLYEIQLPMSFCISHAAAFFEPNTLRYYTQDCQHWRNRELYTFLDIALWFGNSWTFDGKTHLEIGEEEYQMRAEEGGVLARKAKWAKWASKKAVPWEGSRRAVQIAFALLHARDYFWALSSSTMTDQYVSMANMLEKGEVFVCLRCPREAQMKRNWKELVEHFYAETCCYESELLWSKKNGLTPPFHVHNCFSGSTSLGMPVAHSALYIENGGFQDGYCPIGKLHRHEQTETPLTGKQRFSCEICRSIGERFRTVWKTCLKTHVKLRHNKDVLRYGDYKVRVRD